MSGLAPIRMVYNDTSQRIRDYVNPNLTQTFIDREYFYVSHTKIGSNIKVLSLRGNQPLV
jgi:hypothetical protein